MRWAPASTLGRADQDECRRIASELHIRRVGAESEPWLHRRGGQCPLFGLYSGYLCLTARADCLPDPTTEPAGLAGESLHRQLNQPA